MGSMKYLYNFYTRTIRKNAVVSLCRSFTSSEATTCWKCGAINTTVNPICDKCNVVQRPPDKINYFKVFNIQENYDIDQKLLTRTYRKLQSLLHPDKFSNKSKEEKSISADYSALVNKAYDVLQTPLSRAIYILSLHGQNIDENQKIADPEFLMEIMDLNEQVEKAKSPEQLIKLNDENKSMLEKISKEILSHFQNNSIEEAKESIIKMKYYNSIKMHINGIMRERGIIE